MKNKSKLNHLALSATTLLLLGSVTVQAQDAGHTSISSDGAVGDMATELASSSPVSPHFNGTGRKSIESGVSMTVPDVRAMLELKAVNAPVGKESIIGPDTRIRTYTTHYPARAVALITFNGGRCTGWFIGPNTIATAGHCVHSGGARGSWYQRSSYQIYPGYNQTTAPYGSCTAKNLYSVTGWTQSGSAIHDYGAIKLNCLVGNTVGWFGFFWTSSTSSLNNYPAIISGYPGDKPLQQWWSSDTVRATEPYQLFYPNDTIGGMSGSPVWYDRNGPYAMAIHAYGTGSGTYNGGTRITQTVFNNLVAWKNAP